uniref:Uncharacterized protein n=1 Tax=Rhipicephalus zambeziensis TaxID=60191 RepID=A0A224YFK0_9ACAR
MSSRSSELEKRKNTQTKLKNRFITHGGSATLCLYAYGKPTIPRRKARNIVRHLSQKMRNHSELSTAFGGQFIHLSYSFPMALTLNTALFMQMPSC